MPDNLFRKELFSERADWSFAAIDYLAFLMPFMMGFSEHCVLGALLIPALGGSTTSQ
jgi:hypothetical protein